MAMALQGMVGMGCPTRFLGFSKVPSQQRANLACSLTARPASSYSSSSFFSGVSLRPCLNLGGSWLVKERGSTVKVMAKKPSMACTKRSKSRLSRARTSGFRARLATPGGRNILQRRRAKGRWVLCPSTNPNSGKRA